MKTLKIFLFFAISFISCDEQSPGEKCTECVEIVDPQVLKILEEKGLVLFQGNQVSASELEAVTELKLSSGLTTLQDFKKFKNLKSLILVEAEFMRDLDLTGLTSLEEFTLIRAGSESIVEKLNLSDCKQLKFFSMDYHLTGGPGPAGDPALAYSKITSLDFRNNPNLREIDLSGFAKLESISFPNNPLLGKVTFFQMPALRTVEFCDNPAISTFTVINSYSLKNVLLPKEFSKAQATLWEKEFADIDFDYCKD